MQLLVSSVLFPAEAGSFETGSLKLCVHSGRKPLASQWCGAGSTSWALKSVTRMVNPPETAKLRWTDGFISIFVEVVLAGAAAVSMVDFKSSNHIT